MEEKKQHSEEDSSFEALEKEIQEVLNELLGDGSQEKIRVGYEKLTKVLKKSLENEKRLMGKCRELKAEIVANSVKVATAMKLTQEDQTTITSLKKENEKAWKMIDAAHEEELQAKQTIQTLRQEIANLNKLVEQGAGFSTGQKHSMGDLLKTNEKVTAERDKLLSEVVNLREDLTKAIASQQEAEAAQEQTQQTVLQLQQEVQVCQNECSREMERKEKSEKELKQLSIKLEAQQTEIKALNKQNQRAKDEQQRLEQQLREQKIVVERATKEHEQLQAHCTKLQQDNEQNILALEQISLSNNQRASDLKMKEEEVKQVKQENANLSKMREAAQRKLRLVENEKLEVEQQTFTLKNQIIGLEREMEIAKKQMESYKKKMDELVREKDTLHKNMIKAANATEKQQDLVRLQKQTKKTLDQEILAYKDEAQKQRKIIFQLEQERDKHINDASDLTQKVLLLMEEIKAQQMQIFEYRKKIAEAETKLNQQQNLYEAVRTDRNVYSKNLIAAQDEITEMKRKLKLMTHQIDQLKEEITGKEATLVKEHLEFQRVEKEKEALKAELQKMRQQAEDTKRFIDNQAMEERKLLRNIADADAERMRQKKELEKVVSERDILGTHLVRRNDELALLYEKIKIQQSILNKGELQYNQRLEDIRLLKMEIKNLQRKKRNLNKNVSNMEDLRRELHHIQRELLKERARCGAMEQELENPKNVHRWRQLEASDPSTFELIQKIHSLQRRLITKSKEVVEKELLLQEKEKLYVELKHMLARRPGPEAAEQLSIYQQKLREKTKLLKALTAELNMYRSQVQEHRNDTERLAQELQDTKKKYLSLKKRVQQSSLQDEERTQWAGVMKSSCWSSLCSLLFDYYLI
ncbi:cilia- and flagella-associated protein 58 isoform X2 [Astyanax mexicanus]|uniref:cilia- and flagella-associated protein 58 isoform X2 n=1 Tax=Astyanax mexicanus TaxID=7994 RepID=UPI0020CAA9D5|nr:cilia- and flagella-associated protein 58 isoform X2 [Astyanax mexicanus]